MSDPLLLAVDAPEAGTNRGWVQLARTTGGVAKNGDKKFEITPEDIASYAEHIKANPDRIPIDYDHSYAEGGGTRAAGWVDASSVEPRADGHELWAQVDWTPSAADAIRAGEFRYFSPEIAFKERSKKDGVLRKAAEFLAGALTNRPFFKDMAPVRLSEAAPIDNDSKGDPMSKVIATSLGLAEDADEKTIAAAITKRDEAVTAAEAKAKEADEKLTAATKELDELKATASDADKTVATLKETVAGLTKREHERNRKMVLDDAIREGKLTPGEREHMETIYDTAGHEVVASLIKSRVAQPLNKGKGSGEGGVDSFVGLTAKVDGDDVAIDPESAELAARVQAHLRSLKLDRALTQDDYLAAVDAVTAAA